MQVASSHSSPTSQSHLPSATALRFAFGLSFAADIGLFVHAGWTSALIVWALVGVAGVVLVDRVAERIARVPASTQRRLLLGAAIAAAVACVVLYPLANAGIVPGQHERDELILGGLGYLFSGRDPYLFQLGARAPISPFPSWLLVNIPFYLAARISPHGALYALQNVAAFVVLYLLWTRVVRAEVTSYSVFLLGVSLAAPNLVRELVAGSDYLANALLVGAMASVAVLADERVARSRWLLIATGAVLISRLHFALIFAPVAGYYLAVAGFRETVRRLAWMVVPSALVAVAFWAWDPSHFMPLHTSNYLGEWEGTTKFDAGLHFNATFLVDAGLTVATAIGLMIWCHAKRNAAVAMYSVAAVIGVPIVASFLTNSVRRGTVFLGPYSSHFLAVVLLVGMAVALSPYAREPV